MKTETTIIGLNEVEVGKLSANHNQSLIEERPLRALSANHNETAVAQSKGGLSLNHNLTVLSVICSLEVACH